MIFGIVSLIICTIMTFQRELADKNSMSLTSSFVKQTEYFLVLSTSSSSSSSVITTTLSQTLKTTV
jgi:hypothetical protein